MSLPSVIPAAWLLAAGPAQATPSAAPEAEAARAPRSIHALQAEEFGQGLGVIRGSWPPPRRMLPPPTPGPDLRVYGYLPYWSNDLDTVPWDELTDIAIFSAGVDASGNLSDTARWDIAADAVAMAAPYGVRVHLCVTQFDPDTLDALLNSSTARGRLVDHLVDWVADTGAHGVNIDFESLPVSAKPEMVQLAADLDAAVGDVVLATPAVDWNGSWDYDQLTLHADLFIMGYDYFYGGSSYAGPSDPLDAGSGTIWNGVNSYSLRWTANDYQTWGANPARVILGLPLYGRSWPTADNAVPTATLGSGSTVVYSDAWDLADRLGSDFEPDSNAHYLRDGGAQVWFGDVDTVADRIVFARDDAGFAGVGFWALHYDGDDPAFWAGLRAETTTEAPPPDDTGTPPEPTDTHDPGTPSDTGDPTPPPSPDWHASAGQPFLVYVGDTVVLSSEGSTGPDGAAMAHAWTQVQGPTVSLTDAGGASPSFVVEEPGSLAFELRVGDGADAWSAPATSWVVVIDPGLPRRHTGCGCDAGGVPGGFGLALLGAAVVRRSRRRGGDPRG